jgi:hypothetical protein
MRENHKGPFKIKMKLAAGTPKINANQGSVRVAFYRNTQNMWKTWSYPEFFSDQHVCEFESYMV